MARLPNDVKVRDLVGKPVILERSAVAANGPGCELVLPKGLRLMATGMGRALHMRILLQS